jgi:hypothetical protein
MGPAMFDRFQLPTETLAMLKVALSTAWTDLVQLRMYPLVMTTLLGDTCQVGIFSECCRLRA